MSLKRSGSIALVAAATLAVLQSCTSHRASTGASSPQSSPQSSPPPPPEASPESSPSQASSTFTCSEGSPEFFTLKKVDGSENDVSSFTGVRFPGDSPDDFGYAVIHPRDHYNVRFGACVVETDSGFRIEIKNVALKQGDGKPIRQYTLVEKGVGFDEGLAGENAGVEVRASTPEDQGLKYFILAKGQQIGRRNYVVVATGIQTSPGDPIRSSSIHVLTGTLEYGDPFPKDDTGIVCQGSDDFLLKASFKIGTASFTSEACAFPGGGETSGYRVRSFSVTDTNPALGAAAGKTFSIEGKPNGDREGDDLVLANPDGSMTLTYRWHHHNACDSFYLKLRHAEYAVSASPIAGCGPETANAPPREFDEPFGTTKYRFRVGGAGDWNEGTLNNCRHYFFRCESDK